MEFINIDENIYQYPLGHQQKHTEDETIKRRFILAFRDVFVHSTHLENKSWNE